MATWTDRSGTITAGGTAQTLAGINANRTAFEIENLSSDFLWINFTTTAVRNQPSIRIGSGQSLVMDTFVSTELISVIGGTTGQAFTAKESP